MPLIVSASAATSPFASNVSFCARSPFATAVTTFDDAAHLAREVRGHDVDVVGEVLPRAGDARHVRLAAELALGADLARDARDLGRERVELVDDGVDRVLELEDLAL